MSEARFTAIEMRLDRLETGQDGLRQEVRGLGQEVRELGQQMRVLHEDTIDKIMALAPDFAPIRREFTEADAQLREDVDRRLAPLESAIRRRHR